MNKINKVAIIVVAVGIFTTSAFAASPETKSLYKAKCAACHGVDGNASVIGKKLGARDFSMPEVMKQTDTELTDIVCKGKNKMPAYKEKLKEAEIKDLVGYLRELSKKKQ